MTNMSHLAASSVPHASRIAIDDLVEPDDDDHVRAAVRATPGACTINTVEPA